MNRKKLLLLVLGVALAGAAAVYAGREIRRAEAAPAALAQGFAQVQAEHEGENNQLRAKSAQLEMQIIDELRQGNSTASSKDLQSYVSDLEWAKTQAPANSYVQKELDQDIAWCQRKLAHQARTRPSE